MKKTVSLLLALLVVLSSVSAFSAFSDVDSVTQSWAGEAIEALEKSGVINGYEDGTFRPDGDVTRAEFAKMLCTAFECEGEGDEEYTDISGHWAEPYIEKTSALTYTSGEEYRPDENASRAEIAYALSVVCGLDALKPEDTDEKEFADEIFGRFSDAGTVGEEMRYQVALAVESRLIMGYEDDSIRADLPVRRSEAAVLIFRALNFEKPVLSETPDSEDEPADVDEEKTEDEQKPSESDGKNDAVRDEKGPGEEIYDQLLEQGHIYTLYPQKHLLLISSAAKIYDEEGNEDYKLRYYIADTGDEFESVIDGDTVVAGLRSSADEIRSGDVLILDTGFWGKIGCLFVLTSAKNDGDFAAVYPDADEWSLYPGEGDYEVFSGKLLDVKSGSKTYTLTVQGTSKTEELSVLRSVSVDIYDVNGKRSGWENDDLSALADSEDTYVFVRYTDGRASEVVAYVY